MALILSIETSTNTCSVAIHENETFIGGQTHQIEKSHSSLLPGIVEDTLRSSDCTYHDLDAVAVSAGPGSYTGLRIGATTAKGFCYALSIPLIAIDTLDILIETVSSKVQGAHLLCPMLDARRMEVYTKMLDEQGKEIWPLQSKILDKDSFVEFQKTTYIFGNGMPKFREIASQENLVFIDDIYPDASNMGRLAFGRYNSSTFEDVAYFEPNYLKEWRTTTQKKQLL